MEPTQAPDDTQIRNGKDSWSFALDLPTHQTNPDGSQGDPIDWSGSTFTASTVDLPTGTSFTVVPVLTGPTPNVTLSLTGTQILLCPSVVHWYLFEDLILGRTFAWQKITFTDPQ